MNPEDISARLRALDVALIFDAVEALGGTPRCLDLGVRHQSGTGRLAGRVLTVSGRPDPRARSERVPPPWDEFRLFEAVRPGHVLLISTGGEQVAGVWGEILSTAAREQGAVGAVVDGLVRDVAALREMPRWEVFARGTSPVEGNGRWQPSEFDVPIAVPGALTNHVRADPGDWLVADEDGILLLAADEVETVLETAEQLLERESATRRDLLAGDSFAVVYGRYQTF
ncbi:RraA family protein [Natronosporangium hydrolyticum]|uniref:Putative 4-hydroxy-4-methyl-2-oxoglutarate aldolase n=1 Tax=Natronosporangium hydrolyticum TaxID=2811111 RepID=A0A895YC16_9ACTN|nr:RraA family protein [Natronosporangium hydrolyticum]QSB15364.1 RraA family protein [Natronosporangium hydrolyticum]